MTYTRENPASQKTINDLKARVGDLDAKLDAARKMLYEAEISACGAKIGDVIKSEGKLFKVTRIELYSGCAYLHGSPPKKDGTWSSVTRYIGSKWEVVK